MVVGSAIAMDAMNWLVDIIYLGLLALLACYGCYRYYLLWLYYRVKGKRLHVPVAPAHWPSVTIQIPVYNERYVVERAIHAACAVDYPPDRLTIQLLDDSTDDTPEVIARTLAPYRDEGYRVMHLQRMNRQGFKAGALVEGLKSVRDELIAVFDVDFVIPRDFLKRTVPLLTTHPHVGMVQARWGHVNASYSLLTQAQAVLLDGHFAIEQVARYRAGRFFSFNGTAGIWRREAIVSAGGWQADTLTEDLDLSYRAQLAGWQCVFLPDLVAPGELPVEINAFKTQQYRWTKGSIQTARKLLPAILRGSLPWAIKRDAFFHLTGFLSYPLGLLASLAALPLLGGLLHAPHIWAIDLLWLALLAIPGACFYLCAQRETDPHWIKRLAMIPWVVAVGVGLSVNNAWAVLNGLLGRPSVFLRTPKFGIQAKTDRWHHKHYQAARTSTTWIELALALYFGTGCVMAWSQQALLALPCLVVFCVGFAYVGWLSWWQQRTLPAFSLHHLDPLAARL